MNRPICFLLMMVGLAPVTADETQQALQTAILEMQQDIRRDTESLNALRARVEQERQPLQQELNRLREEVRGLRRDVDRARQLRTSGESEQAALASQAQALRDEASFLRAMFSEYARDVDTRMHVARDPELITLLEQARTALDDSGIPLSEGVAPLMQFSLRWNTSRIGGTTFSGSALDATGVEHPGTFALFGPLAYFNASEPQGPSGMVTLQFGADQAAVVEGTSREQEQIAALIRGAAAVVPVDTSGGDALRVAKAKPGMVEHLKQGGFTMIPLAAVGLAALILSLWKTVDLSRMRLKQDEQIPEVIRALQSGNVDQATQIARSLPAPVKQLAEDLVQYRDAPREHLEEIMGEHILASLPFVERNLGTLAVLGGVAPLLGLLGTVTGMIHTFQLVTLFGSGDAKLLSGGISEALVTTETGLAIAIPTLLAHAFLSRRARGLVASLETLSVSMVNDLKLRDSEV
jgi:biopolymer transport protein ExbB